MESTENFKKVIQQHLQDVAANDSLFAETFKKENKNIDDCVKYILGQVSKSGCNGFEDNEIFQMAIHYYDEDDLEILESNVSRIVTNHKVELTQEDIDKAKKEALNDVISEQKIKLTKKAETKKTAPKVVDQIDLFD